MSVAEGAKNVSWPWLSPLRGSGSLTMAFTGKFVHIYIYIYIYIYICIYIIRMVNILGRKSAKTLPTN